MDKCCIVIPCYNESNRINKAEYLSFLSKNNFFTFLFVDDGSADNTLEILKELNSSCLQIKYIRLEKNSGKAEAVRFGVTEVLKNDEYKYIGFLDADLAIPLEELKRLYDIISSENKYTLTFLSKVKKKDSEVNQKLERFIIGRILSLMTRISLKLPIYDTQCGCKLMHKTVAETVFNQPFISSWLFDIEIFWRFIIKYKREFFLKYALEVSLQKLNNTGKTKINIKDLLKLPFEFLKIHSHYSKINETKL